MLRRPRSLVGVVLFVVAAAGCGPADEASSDEASSRSILAAPGPTILDMQCDTVVTFFETSLAAAQAALPEGYTVAVQPSGNAQTVLQVSNCSAVINGREVPYMGLADLWLTIDGPMIVDPVPGTYFTLPHHYVYVFKAQTTSPTIHSECAKVFDKVDLVKSIDVGGPAAPLRSGSVVEPNGAGYSWTEIVPCMAPPGSPWGECWFLPAPNPQLPIGYLLPEFPLGSNLVGYADLGAPNGASYRKGMQCVLGVAGQGLFQLSLDPNSELAKFGLLQDGQIGAYLATNSDCHLEMSRL